ncbi:MAG: hypothetical protein K0R18_3124 [Bacillales bacterium]|nr:hypothetical protein [Bacillales bacterium]
MKSFLSEVKILHLPIKKRSLRQVESLRSLRSIMEYIFTQLIVNTQPSINACKEV